MISVPQIRGAIQEYQTQLIDSVKEDIKRLHDKVNIDFLVSDHATDIFASLKLSTGSRKRITCLKCATFPQ